MYATALIVLLPAVKSSKTHDFHPSLALSITEVQIAMHRVGICGSDVHYWTHGAIGDFIVRAPMVMGHESAGLVNEVGEGVTTLKVGEEYSIL